MFNMFSVEKRTSITASTASVTCPACGSSDVEIQAVAVFAYRTPDAEELAGGFHRNYVCFTEGKGGEEDVRIDLGCGGCGRDDLHLHVRPATDSGRGVRLVSRLDTDSVEVGA
jgi:hypothetical protein